MLAEVLVREKAEQVEKEKAEKEASKEISRLPVDAKMKAKVKTRKDLKDKFRSWYQDMEHDQ